MHPLLTHILKQNCQVEGGRAPSPVITNRGYYIAPSYPSKTPFINGGLQFHLKTIRRGPPCSFMLETPPRTPRTRPSSQLVASSTQEMRLSKDGEIYFAFLPAMRTTLIVRKPTKKHVDFGKATLQGTNDIRLFEKENHLQNVSSQ